jgi:hypothetical protein
MFYNCGSRLQYSALSVDGVNFKEKLAVNKKITQISYGEDQSKEIK